VPYPNVHVARLRNPKDFKKTPDWASDGQFRTTHGGTIYGKKKVPKSILITWGQLKTQSGQSAAPQRLSFPITHWTAARARKWLKDNNIKYIKFEPATGKLKKSAMTFFRKDATQQIVTAVVYSPYEKDAHGEGTTPDVIEQSMIEFMKEGPTYTIGHGGDEIEATLIENWIVRESFNEGGYTIKKGAWCQSLYIPDPDVWAQIESGELTGFSLEGFCVRDPLT